MREIEELPDGAVGGKEVEDFIDGVVGQRVLRTVSTDVGTGDKIEPEARVDAAHDDDGVAAVLLHQVGRLLDEPVKAVAEVVIERQPIGIDARVAPRVTIAAGGKVIVRQLDLAIGVTHRLVAGILDGHGLAARSGERGRVVGAFRAAARALARAVAARARIADGLGHARG